MRPYFNKSGDFQIFKNCEAESWSSVLGSDNLFLARDDWIYFSFDAMRGAVEDCEITDGFALRWLVLNNHDVPEALSEIACQFNKTA